MRQELITRMLKAFYRKDTDRWSDQSREDMEAAANVMAVEIREIVKVLIAPSLKGDLLSRPTFEEWIKAFDELFPPKGDECTPAT